MEPLMWRNSDVAELWCGEPWCVRQATGSCCAQAIKELGISFRPVEETLADMARSLIVAGRVKPNFGSGMATVANGTAIAAWLYVMATGSAVLAKQQWATAQRSTV
jgi:hypothetical protein